MKKFYGLLAAMLLAGLISSYAAVSQPTQSVGAQAQAELVMIGEPIEVELHELCSGGYPNGGNPPSGYTPETWQYGCPTWTAITEFASENADVVSVDVLWKWTGTPGQVQTFEAFYINAFGQAVYCRDFGNSGTSNQVCGTITADVVGGQEFEVRADHAHANAPEGSDPGSVIPMVRITCWKRVIPPTSTATLPPTATGVTPTIPGITPTAPITPTIPIETATPPPTPTTPPTGGEPSPTIPAPPGEEWKRPDLGFEKQACWDGTTRAARARVSWTKHDLVLAGITAQKDQALREPTDTPHSTYWLTLGFDQAVDLVLAAEKGTGKVQWWRAEEPHYDPASVQESGLGWLWEATGSKYEVAKNLMHHYKWQTAILAWPGLFESCGANWTPTPGDEPTPTTGPGITVTPVTATPIPPCVGECGGAADENDDLIVIESVSSEQVPAQVKPETDDNRLWLLSGAFVLLFVIILLLRRKAGR